MYSCIWRCLARISHRRIDYKGSPAHMSIGKLVTWINNNVITVAEAEAQFVTLLGKGN
jgi:hypothetical protein